MKSKKILITGGAGFIGTNFVRLILNKRPQWSIVNLDALTYAGNIKNFEDMKDSERGRYEFIHGDICDADLVGRMFDRYSFDGVIHFAAESHVDRSIIGPETFLETNVTGTFRLLAGARKSWEGRNKPDSFRFLHISTDEVYGSLSESGYFTEQTPYDPSSPYSASKASSDHFVRAYNRTYGLPTLITNCSNNFGPYQFPEKLIPLMVLNIIENKPLPVYGDGKNVRDWLYVLDHCEALLAVFENGRPGETYTIGGSSERRNIDVVYFLCDLLDKRLNRSGKNKSRNLVEFVTDRPGHDRRYAIDATKIREQIGWSPGHRFEEALDDTVEWYLNNMDWVNSVRSGEYRNWVDLNYGRRESVLRE